MNPNLYKYENDFHKGHIEYAKQLLNGITNNKARFGDDYLLNSNYGGLGA